MAKLTSINPGNERVVGLVKISIKNEVVDVFKRAKKFSPWSRIPFENQKEKEELAKIIILEMGKPLKEVLEEVRGTLEEIHY